jgi:hypothetical protein
MRITIDLAKDVAAAVEEMRRDRGIGLSAAVDELARGGLPKSVLPGEFCQRTYALGLQIDVVNVAEALETCDGLASR